MQHFLMYCDFPIVQPNWLPTWTANRCSSWLLVSQRKRVPRVI